MTMALGSTYKIVERVSIVVLGGIVVTLLFAILGKLVLNREMVVPANNDLLHEQETFLSAVHPELRWVYRLGVFLAFIGTLDGAFEVYRHTFVEIALVTQRSDLPQSHLQQRGLRRLLD